MKVVELSEEDVKHIGEARLVLEIIISKLVMFYGADADFVQLHKIAEECKEGIQAQELYERVSSDCKFHLDLAKLSNNEILVSFMQKILMYCGIVQADEYREREKAERQSEIHDRIVDALLERDKKGVNQILVSGLMDFYHLDRELIAMIFSQKE